LSAGLLIILTVLFSSYILKPFVFLFVFGIGVGVSKGFALSGSFKAGWTYLPGRKGLMSGLVMSAVALGSIIYGISCTRIVNPDNVRNVKEEVAPKVYESFFPSYIN
jgi:hypothetical protein